MRIGIVGLLHESNTFSSQLTNLACFRDDLYLSGVEIPQRLATSHHEVGGFLQGLAKFGPEEARAVPLFFARALPSGTILAAAFHELVSSLVAQVARAGQLDGILAAVHGATVSQLQRDADGYWLSQLREQLGPHVPLVATLDAHANLSARMVAACDALLGYRSNPHLDQRARGQQAAELLVRTIRGEVHPRMSAVFPPMTINIDRQCTDDEPLRSIVEFADGQLEDPRVLSNSILLGFPYADVEEMGTAAVVITDGDGPLADRLADELGERLWQQRRALQLQAASVDAVLAQCEDLDGPICLLDMGDNVGGGSAADGTVLLQAILRRRVGPSFVCLFDPQSVKACQDAGPGAIVNLSVGGKTDGLHGSPVEVQLAVQSLHHGRFEESEPRHGGFMRFDQGATAIAHTPEGATLMSTSRRMVPFSLSQLTSCGLDPSQFKLLVAKGVNAPLAAYRAVCRRFFRVNTPGSTTADVRQLPYQYRRRPLFPWEEFDWQASRSSLAAGNVASG